MKRKTPEQKLDFAVERLGKAGVEEVTLRVLRNAPDARLGRLVLAAKEISPATEPGFWAARLVPSRRVQE